MTTAEACKILQDAAQDRGIPLLDFLGEVAIWTDEYTLSIQDAYHVFMRAGREMFAPI